MLPAMLLPRRAAAAASWQLARGAGRTCNRARCFATEAASPVPEAVDAPSAAPPAPAAAPPAPAAVAPPAPAAVAPKAPAAAAPKAPATPQPAKGTASRAAAPAARSGAQAAFKATASRPVQYTKAKATPVASKPAPHAIPSVAVYEPTTIAFRSPSSPADPAAVAAVDWSTSFHGISARPVTEEQFKVLMQAIQVKDIEVKPDGIIYLPEIKYRRRLNEVFGPMGWGLIPKGEPIVGEGIVTREYALVADGRFVSQAQGENGFFSPDQLPSAVEGCKSNALMRCCKDLGIGSELWDPQFLRWFKKTNMEEVWVEHVTTKKKRVQWYRKGMVEVAYPYKLANASDARR